MSPVIHPTSIVTNCQIGHGVTIGPFCLITDSVIGEGTIIEGNARIEKSITEKDVEILWGAIIRDSTLGEGSVIGCEVKKSHLNQGNKAKHNGTSIAHVISGKGVNFGGGARFANYDGHGKGNFIIGDNVFIGCNSVISVKAEQVTTIHTGVKIGALVHVNRDIPAHSLVYHDRETGLMKIREGYYGGSEKGA